jgi:hypothetical protein
MPTKKFPKFGLADAIEVASHVYNQNRSCKVSTLATAMNCSEKASGFKQRKFAAKAFALITEDDEQITATDLAVKIVDPYSTEEQISALQQAFSNVDVFREVLDHLPINTPFSRERIGQLAVREFGIPVENKEIFTDVFVTSAETACLLKSDEAGLIRQAALTSDNNGDQGKVQPQVPPQSITSRSNDDKKEVGREDVSMQTQIHANHPFTVNINLNISADTPEHIINIILDRFFPNQGAE